MDTEPNKVIAPGTPSSGPTAVDGPKATPAMRAALEAAVSACSAVTSDPETKHRLVNRAVRSYISGGSAPRLPTYLVLGDSVDIAVLRILLVFLFNADSVFSRVWAPAAFINSQGCVIQDLTTINAGFLYWIRTAAYHRSFANWAPPLEAGAPAVTITPRETVLIISSAFAAEASQWGHVIELARKAPDWVDPDALVASLCGWKKQVRLLAAILQADLRVQFQDVPNLPAPELPS